MAICLLTFALPSAFAAGDYPVFVAKVANPNDYSLFANAGWDGNWYVGFNTCWVKKLPVIPAGNYARAFLGVKLGRMKSQPRDPKRPWEKTTIPGDIYMAISSTGAWTREQSYFVARTQDIPLEGDPENALEGVGESQWFWGEVPLDQVNLSGDNFVALWSPTEALVTASSAPILAATWGGKEQDNWLSHDVRGAPPLTAEHTFDTPISYFQPAIALKLIPKVAEGQHPLSVQVIGWRNGTPEHLKPIVTADVKGDEIESAWLEYMKYHTWTPVGRPLWKAPYIFSVEQTELPQGRVRLRVAACNIWEDRAASEPFTVEVSTVSAAFR
jgi:hypothetical protein